MISACLDTGFCLGCVSCVECLTQSFKMNTAHGPLPVGDMIAWGMYLHGTPPTAL